VSADKIRNCLTGEQEKSKAHILLVRASEASEHIKQYLIPKQLIKQAKRTELVYICERSEHIKRKQIFKKAY